MTAPRPRAILVAQTLCDSAGLGEAPTEVAADQARLERDQSAAVVSLTAYRGAVRVRDLVGPRQARWLHPVRAAAAHVMRSALGLPAETVAAALGRVQTRTVHAWAQEAERLLAADVAFAALVDRVLADLATEAA